MSWIYLILAGFFEIGWAFGMKIYQTTSNKILCIILTGISLILSGFFLWLSQKTIPISTSYLVWTGIGAIGTVLIGIIVFKDSCNFWRLVSVFFIIIGIVGLKLAENFEN
jgi:quaternary ammonium compound-resistance protein SugE